MFHDNQLFPLHANCHASFKNVKPAPIDAFSGRLKPTYLFHFGKIIPVMGVRNTVLIISEKIRVKGHFVNFGAYRKLL